MAYRFWPSTSDCQDPLNGESEEAIVRAGVFRFTWMHRKRKAARCKGKGSVSAVETVASCQPLKIKKPMDNSYKKAAGLSRRKLVMPVVAGLVAWSAPASAATLYYAPNSGGTSWNAGWVTTNTGWSSSNTTFTGATPASSDDLVFSYAPTWGSDQGKFLNTPAGQTRTMNSLTFINNVAVIRQNGSQAQAGLILGGGGLTLASTKTGSIAFGRGDNIAENFTSGTGYMPFFLTDSQTWANDSSRRVEVRDGIAPSAAAAGTTGLTIGGSGAGDFFVYGGAPGREFTGAVPDEADPLSPVYNNRLTGDKTVNPEGIRDFGDNIMNLTVTGSTVTLEGIHTFSGATSVTGGALRLQNGTLSGGGAISVAAGGTLGGGGTVAGATTITGTLAPGNSTDLLTFEDSLSLAGNTHLEIGGLLRGLEYDAVDVGLANGLTFGGDLLLDFIAPAAVGDFSLFGFSGTAAGSFANVSLGGLYSGNLDGADGIWTGVSDGYTFTFSELSGELSVIPEPGTYALLAGLGALGVAAWVRRKQTRAS
jgi:hypothetical protein